jgi:hypothetical protein
LAEFWPLLAIPVLALAAGAIVLAAIRPAMALPLLVMGIAVHNLLLAVLLAVGTPVAVVRFAQAWKDVIAVVLVLHLARRALAVVRREGLGGTFATWWTRSVSLRAIDGALAGFTILLCLYLILPSGILSGGEAPTLAQRVLSFRMLALLPLTYASSRFLMPGETNLRTWAIAIGGTAAVVALVGLAELFFMPTSHWLKIGIQQFTALQGYAYGGPRGLPENFFQGTSAGLLRRMVSTYLSPLGIAYTGLLVVPLLAAASRYWSRASSWWWLCYYLVAASVALSVTRLALLVLVGEAVLMVMFWPRRRMVLAAGVTTGMVAVALLVYPLFGPLVHFDLTDARRPVGLVAMETLLRPDLTTPGSSSESPAVEAPSQAELVERMMDASESSVSGHIGALARGIPLVLEHPWGLGLGASVYRMGQGTGPEESAILGIAGEMGIPALGLFAVAYASLVLVGVRLLRSPVGGRGLVPGAVIGIGGVALLPVMLTSAIWGDLSVTYVFWSAAGLAVAAWDTAQTPSKAALVDPPGDAAREAGTASATASG